MSIFSVQKSGETKFEYLDVEALRRTKTCLNETFSPSTTTICLSKMSKNRIFFLSVRPKIRGARDIPSTAAVSKWSDSDESINYVDSVVRLMAYLVDALNTLFFSLNFVNFNSENSISVFFNFFNS